MWTWRQAETVRHNETGGIEGLDPGDVEDVDLLIADEELRQRPIGIGV
jgi:hypothetical protein